MMNPNIRILSICLEARSRTRHGSALPSALAAPMLTAQAPAPNGQIGSGDIFGRELSSIVYGDQGRGPSK